MIKPMAMSSAKSLCDTFYLALVIWRESRGVSQEAQVAVAHTVMNRVARPGWWGHTVDEVTTKKWQYSSLAAPGDPQLILWPKLSDSSWLACLGVAYDVIHGDVLHPMPGADSYYDDSIAAPKWAATARFCGKIDNLNFYDVDHDYETSAIATTIGGMYAPDFDARLAAFLAGKP